MQRDQYAVSNRARARRVTAQHRKQNLDGAPGQQRFEILRSDAELGSLCVQQAKLGQIRADHDGAGGRSVARNEEVEYRVSAQQPVPDDLQRYRSPDWT